MYRSAWAKVLLLSSTPFLFPTESLARSDNAYGVNAPFGMNDLPPGILKQQLDDLPPAAQKRALNWMHRFSFTKQDVPMLRVDKSGGVFYEDPAFEGRISAAVDSDTARVLSEDYGEHLPGINMKSKVYVLEKT